MNWWVQVVLGAALTVTTTGIVGAVALLLRLDRRVAYQNGSLARVVKDFDQHCRDDHDDFVRVHARLDELLARSAL